MILRLSDNNPEIKHLKQKIEYLIVALMKANINGQKDCAVMLAKHFEKILKQYVAVTRDVKKKKYKIKMLIFRAGVIRWNNDLVV